MVCGTAGKKFGNLVHLPTANKHEAEIASFLQMTNTTNNFFDLPWLAGDVSDFTLFSMVIKRYRVQWRQVSDPRNKAQHIYTHKYTAELLLMSSWLLLQPFEMPGK